MSSEETREFEVKDAAMLVDVPDDLAPFIVSTLALLPVRCRHPRQACERMLTTRPQVIVIGGDPSDDELGSLSDVAVAVCAQIVLLRDVDVANRKKLELHLRSALLAAQRSRSLPPVEIDEEPPVSVHELPTAPPPPMPPDEPT